MPWKNLPIETRREHELRVLMRGSVLAPGQVMNRARAVRRVVVAVVWQGTPPFGGSPGSYALSGSRLDIADVFRVGARVPSGPIALAAGTGVGLALDTLMPSQTTTSDLAPPAPDGLDFSWYVPVWASITLKTSCNWGLQALGSYDVDPSDSASDRTEILAGLEYQPSDACSERPYMTVKP